VSRKVPLTVILPVKDEEENLADTLASVGWADELIVVDSHSTDRTADLARAAGAEVVQFDYIPGGRKKKSWALSTLRPRNEWLLLLDADERIPEGLRAEIERAVGAGERDGYYLDRELVFMGRRLRCFSPNWNLRLFRAGRGRMEDLELEGVLGTGDNEIHEHVVVDGRLGYLRTRLLHDDYRGLTAWLDKHNRYATWEAHLYRKLRREPIGVSPLGFLRLDAFRRKRVLRRMWVRLPLRPPLRFLVWYVGRRGFLDGGPGLAYCMLMSYYELVIGLKLRELESGDRSQ
jgi:glycosyltransferase involved in cell wall biosynthesis